MRSNAIVRPIVVFAALVSSVIIAGSALAQGDVTKETDFRKIKPPAAHGTVIMNRSTASSAEVKPVVFPHWAHRDKYSCKACHTDIGFKLKSNTTGVTQADIEAGKYCGECHNGKAAFAATECNRCHSYGIEVKENRKFDDAVKGLPADHFGNKVDWVKALNEKKIKAGPAPGGKDDLQPLDLDVIIPVTKFVPHPPDVKFPHKPHTEQMDCTTCHTAIFKQQKGGNPEMNMMKIMAGQYCGVCHTRVAFPLDDCFRCHSQPAPKAVELERELKDDKAKDKEKEKK